MSIPETVFGRCPNCGGKGEDYESDDEILSGADKVRSGYGNGVELIRFRDAYICEMCKTNILNREETDREVDLDQRDKRLRGQARFNKSVPSDERLASYDA